MRWGTQKWLWLATPFFLLAACFWFWHGREAKREPNSAEIRTERNPLTVITQAAAPANPSTFPFLSQPGLLNSAPAPSPAAQPRKNSRFAHRLTNTSLSVGQLARKDKALLLENALLDTDELVGLKIPSSLQAQGDPGSYVVQSRGALD